MDGFELYDEMEKLIMLLDVDELPELHEYFASIMDEENGVSEGPYKIANHILQCDIKEKLPEIVRDFVIELFEDAFRAGNADAANDLGAQYYNGSRGFEQDFSKAVHYYNIAAENGSRQAQENLGYCYYYGRNMPVDYEKAFHYFALGAFDGHLISLYKIGDMYVAGYYVKKNEKEAFHIYERCIDTMTDEAAPIVAGPVFLRLGKCFLNGVGTEPNYKNALICYQKAETFLFDMVRNGDVMYKRSLQAAISGQAMARTKLLEEMPN
jgi:hypothetical protein